MMQGLYALYDTKKTLTYIGKSSNIPKRLSSHNQEFSHYRIMHIDNDSDLEIFELLYIDKYKPIKNKDSKFSSTSTLLQQIDIDIEKYFTPLVPKENQRSTVKYYETFITSSVGKRYYRDLMKLITVNNDSYYLLLVSIINKAKF